MTSEKRDAPKDVVSIGPTLPSGEVQFVRSHVDEESGDTIVEVGTGTVHSPEDPMRDDTREHLKLRHIGANRFEVTEAVKGTGPAKVNSAAFRSNWDSIFGVKQPVGQA